MAIDIDSAGKLGAIVEVNSETDFVAKNADFVQFAKDLAKLVATKKPSDAQALALLPLGSGTVEQTRTALVGKIGENISIRRFARVEAKGRLASYIHGGSKIGVLVDVVGGDSELAKDVAMHIAASKPKSLDAAGVPPELLDTERRIAVEKARDAGKPEAMLDKIAEGTVQKYLREVTLLGQVFVKAEDGKQTIEQLQRPMAPASASLCCTSSAKGSNESNPILQPRSLQWRRRASDAQVGICRPTTPR